MKITFARGMTSEEVAQFRNSLRKNYLSKKDSSVNWCAENEKKIIQDHAQFMVDLEEVDYQDYFKRMYNYEYEHNTRIESHNEYVDYVNEIANKLRNNEKVLCGCGNSGYLRRVKTDKYDFIGCGNYTSNLCEKITYNFYEKKQAEDINIKTFSEWLEQKDLKYTYLSKIKSLNNYPKFVRPSDIYRTLKLHGVTFYCEITEDNFSNGKKASQQSKHEEDALLKRLESLPGINVLYQHGFYYKTDQCENNSKYKLAFPDYILLKGKKAVILDAKKSIDNCHLSQLEKYKEILLKAAKQPIEVEYYHILFDRSNATADEIMRNRVITINDLKNEFN
jgi:hypothetical protein